MRENAIWTWKNADAIIRVNKKDIPIFIKYDVNPKKIYYIPNGYNPEKIKYISKNVARKHLGLDINSKIIFNLARLYPEKGQQYLIEAMNHVLKERDDILCFIGGDGPLRKKLQRQIKELKLEAHVKILRYLPNKEIQYWMNASDIFVLPSLSEGNPTVMFEALGVALPFVGTKVGGIPEIIISENYGLLVEPGNPKDLAEKILIALEKEWNRSKIQKYAQQFTWSTIAEKYDRILWQVTNYVRT